MKRSPVSPPKGSTISCAGGGGTGLVGGGGVSCWGTTTRVFYQGVGASGGGGGGWNGADLPGTGLADTGPALNTIGVETGKTRMLGPKGRGSGPHSLSASSNDRTRRSRFVVND